MVGRARRALGTVAVAALALSPLQLVAGPAGADVGGSLTLTPAGVVMKNELLQLSGSLPPNRPRSVRLQRQVDGGAWATLRTWQSGTTGAFSTTTKIPTTMTPPFTVRYRVLAPAATLGGTTYPEVETPTIERRVVPQRSSLDAPTRVRTSTAYQVQAAFYPPRAGRPVTLERRNGSRWVQADSGTTDADGLASFTRTATVSGSTTWRMRAPTWQGLAPALTVSRTVQALATGDVTAPPVPGGVGAERDGATVTVRWDPVTAPDLAGYRVYRGITVHGPWTAINTSPTSTTGLVDTGYEADSVYAVTSVDQLGNESARSAPVVPGEGGDTTPPTTPGGLVADPGENSVDLRWDAVGDADLAGYRVYVAESAAGPWTSTGDGPVTEPHARVTGLSNDTVYHFAVTSLDDLGNESDRSPSASATPADRTAPPVPSGLDAAASDGRVDLAWEAVSADDLAGYRVYRAPAADGPWTQVGGTTTGTTATVSPLTNGTTYFFAVTAVDRSDNESGRSTPGAATPADTTAPPSPLGLSATRGDGEVRLSWQQVTADEDVTGYRVYRAPAADGPWTQVDDVLTGTSKDVTGLSNDTTYWFSVTSVDGADNESDRTEARSATPTDLTAPGVPTGLVATPGDGRVDLAWDAVSADDVAGYRVRQADGPDGPWTEVPGGLVTGTETRVTGLTNGTRTWFSVAAVDTHANESDRSPAVSAVPVDQTPPPVPTGLGSEATDARVALSWDDVTASDLDGYLVYRSDGATGPWTALTSSPVTATSYVDRSVVNATTYWYAVASVDGTGNVSERSTATSATPQGPTANAIVPRTVAAAEMSCRNKADGSLWCWGTLNGGADTRPSAVTRIGAANDWAQIDAAYSTLCGVKVDQTLWCGDGSAEAPTQVGTDTDWTSVDVGMSHRCAVKRDHSLWCWGQNNSGQLGNGSTDFSSSQPVRVGDGQDWAAVSAGDWTTCGLRNDRSLWCWGLNLNQLIQPGTASSAVRSPVRIGSSNDWMSASVGGSHICGIRDPGQLWCWGSSGTGAEGHGFTYISQLSRVGSADDWTQVSAGREHTCGLRSDGSAWCWGSNRLGQLGIGSTTSALVPTAMGTADSWSSLTVGDLHTCGELSGGGVRCWGSNAWGQIGTGPTAVVTSPQEVSGGQQWTSAAASNGHVCATRSDQTLWCRGSNQRGQLGDGTHDTRGQFVPVGTSTWTRVVTGTDHTCAITTSGELWCWGFNAFFQLGDGTATERTSPSRIGTASDWVDVDAAQQHTCGVRSTGTLWCWGTGYYGQLGLGTVTSASSPTQVGSSTDWVDVSVGTANTCATRADATLWCWGDNLRGQVGDGTRETRSTPTQVGTAEWRSVSVADHLVCALKLDGSAWCWGSNAYSTLGNGSYGFTVYDSPVPGRVGTAADWTSIDTGDSSVCGVRGGGQLWCWGDNSQGLLGTGALNGTYASPVRLGAASDWTGVSTSLAKCGVTTGGQLRCWGWNFYGMVGPAPFSTSPALPGG